MIFDIEIKGKKFTVDVEDEKDLPQVAQEIANDPSNFREPDLIDKLLPTGLAELGGRGAADFEEGRMNLIGDLFERRPAIIREALRGKGAEGILQAERDPKSVENFQDQFIRQAQFTKSPTLNAILGTPASAAGLGLDYLSDPVSTILGIGAGKGISALAKNPAVSQFLTKQRTPVANVIDKVRPLTEKLKSDFVNQRLAPRINKLFVQSVDDFGTSVQKFAVNKLKAPKEVVNHISKQGTNLVRKMGSAFKDNVDNIVSVIENKITAKNAQIGKLYEQAFSQIDDNTRIGLSKTFKTMEKSLKEVGFIDELGNPTKFGLNESRNRTLGSVLDTYQSLKPQGSFNVGVKTSKNVGGVSKKQWTLLRDDLTKLYRAEPGQRGNVKRILDSLHTDAEDAGLKGIKKARNAFVEYLDNVNFADKVNKSKLDGIFKKDIKFGRELSKLEDYLGVKIETPAKDIVAARTLGKLDNLNIEQQVLGQRSLINQQLNAALNPAETSTIKSGFEDIVGKSSELDDIFNQIKSFRKIQTIKKGAGTALKIGGAAALGVKAFSD